jgi:hypothetical protein
MESVKMAGSGFDIVDSFHAPLGDSAYETKTHIDTKYGGGGGTGFFSTDGVFGGGEELHSMVFLLFKIIILARGVHSTSNT